MSFGYKNYVCISESGKVEKYASSSIGGIIDKKERPTDQFVSIICTGKHHSGDGYDQLEGWE